jgi:glycolate oxidase
VEKAAVEIMKTCIEAGGTITGEHGVGLDKMRYMPNIFDEDSLAAMLAVRKAFDPVELANPGKVVPTYACSEWKASRNLRAAAR